MGPIPSTEFQIIDFVSEKWSYKPVLSIQWSHRRLLADQLLKNQQPAYQTVLIFHSHSIIVNLRFFFFCVMRKKLGNYMIHLVSPSSTFTTVYKRKKTPPHIVGNGKKLSWTILNKLMGWVLQVNTTIQLSFGRYKLSGCHKSKY